MKLNKKLLIIILIIIISAIIVQVSRQNVFSRNLSVNQKKIKLNLNYSNSILPNDYRKFVFLYSTDSPGNKLIYYQVNEVFKLTKLNIEFVNIEKENSTEIITSLTNNDLIIIGTENIENYRNNELIVKYVKNGGTVVSLLRNHAVDLDEIFGIKEQFGFRDKDLIGLKFTKKFFPGLDEIEITNELISHSIINMKLSPNVDVIATSENTPIIWENDYYLGRTMYVNSTMLMDKNNRGVLLQTILYPLKYSIYNIMNAFILDIDDFPAPIKRGKSDIIFKEYSLKNTQFYRQIWLSDIINLAYKMHIKITGLIIGTYNNNTSLPIKKLGNTNIEDIQYYGRRLKENGGEIGIHGYNHQSLALKGEMNHESYGYKPWESKKAMVSALTELRDEIYNIYGKINIFTYVAPSNIISIEGKEAVKEVFKDIVVFAGIYTGSPEKGVLYQEYGPDPDIKGVYTMPRISSGYENTKENMWSIYNSIATYGVFNHFIHPDDVLDKERSDGKTWRELYKEFTALITDTKNRFPFLRNMTDYEAYNYFRSSENLKVYTNYKDHKIYIYNENFISPVYYILRINGKVTDIKGGTYSLFDKDLNLYIIECTDKNIIISTKE
ncbi:DUF2194 domain-containing protein [Helicovermis profundi]|uniref:DUF2194 domain-containing protein n=1 Tax=Helicovermis profundi TaxID=3065157 RepID=A0AAU9E1U8_9FIRM|nr:DUF2194 domain-containing protein [Clostridia bacterium S502]